jgi:hypothetical protein
MDRSLDAKRGAFGRDARLSAVEFTAARGSFAFAKTRSQI